MFTTRFEINVTDRKLNPLVAVDLAMKHSCPAIVTIPELVAPFIAARSMRKALFKIILAVDLPDGDNFAMLKLRDLGNDALAADGFDIVSSKRRKPIESLNEVKSLTEFIVSMNPFAEIRWSIGAIDRAESDYAEHLKSLHKYPCSMIRTDHRLFVGSGVGVDKHKLIVNSIRKYVASPIKLSGNIDRDTYLAFENDKSIRFDVTADQFNSLRKSVIGQANEQKKEESTQKEPSAQTIIDDEEIIGTLGKDVE
jgi:hypothetical protein